MPLTLADYAAAKGLPVDFLASLGVSEETTSNGPRLRIPYQAEDGGELIARFRHALEGKAFSWPKGSAGLLVLYGLNRLPRARETGHVVIVEGELDAQTLWFNDLPAVGVPGASNWNEGARRAGARRLRDCFCGRRGRPGRGGAARQAQGVVAGFSRARRLHAWSADAAPEVEGPVRPLS